MSAIAGVAMPQQSRSHFTAKDAWWSGVGGAPSQTGWLGRWLDLSLDAERNGVDDPLRAIALGGGSPALVGVQTTATAIRDPAAFTLATGPGVDEGGLVEAFLATASALNAEPTLAAAQQAIPGTLDAVALLAAAAGSDSLSAYENPTPGAGRTAVDLFSTAANIIAMGIGTRVLTVGVRGFDTHADQVENHQAEVPRRHGQTQTLGFYESSLRELLRDLTTKLARPAEGLSWEMRPGDHVHLLLPPQHHH